MNIEQLVAEFAKSTKVSKAKALAFAESVVAQAKEEMPKPGRKTTDESIRTRQAIKEMQDVLKGNVFTIKELAEKIEADPVYVNNNIRWLAKHEGLFKVEGKKDKLPGQKGKKELLWTVA